MEKNKFQLGQVVYLSHPQRPRTITNGKIVEIEEINITRITMKYMCSSESNQKTLRYNYGVMVFPSMTILLSREDEIYSDLDILKEKIEREAELCKYKLKERINSSTLQMKMIKDLEKYADL